MKKFFEWNNRWVLGIEAMDQQHHQLAVMLTEIVALYLDVGGQRDSEQRSNQLNDQMNLFHEKVREHFDDEEDLMLKADYPGYTEHAHDHSMLLAELKLYIRRIEEERDDINMGTLSELKVWFISHILSSDKEFADFLQKHSVNT